MMKRLTQKLTVLFLTIVAVSIFGSCSKSEDNVSPLLEEDSKEATISLDLSATASPEDLSLIASGSRSALRSVSFDTSGVLPKIDETKTSFVSHAFFRKAGSSFVGYGAITWTVKGRDGSGKIKLVAKVTLPLENTGGVEPQVGERWYVSAVLGGGTLDETKTKVDFSYDHATDMSMQPDEIRVPLLSKWVPVTVATEAVTSRVVCNAVLSFKPQGVLYKVELTNRSGEDLSENKIRLETEASSTLGAFDFSHSSNPESSISSGNYQSSFVHTTTAGTVEYMERPISPVANGGKVVALAWGMPFDATASDNRHLGVFYPHRHVTKTSGSAGNMRYFGPVVWSSGSTGAGAVNGKVVRLSGDIGRPALPLEYFAASFNRVNWSQLYDYDTNGYQVKPGNLGMSTVQPPLGHEIMGHNVWFMPNLEWRYKLAPGDENGIGGARDALPLAPSIPIFRKFLGKFYDGYYQAHKDGSVGAYALLFTGAGDNLRSAWHWQYDPVLQEMRITARWLGAHDTTPFSTVASPTYWASNNQDDVSITFPTANPAVTGHWFGGRKYFWMNDSPMRGWALFFHKDDGTVWIDGFRDDWTVVLASSY